MASPFDALVAFGVVGGAHMVVEPMLGVHGRVMDRFAFAAVNDSGPKGLRLVRGAYVVVEPMLGMDRRVMGRVLGVHRRMVCGLIVLLLLRIDAEGICHSRQCSSHYQWF